MQHPFSNDEMFTAFSQYALRFASKKVVQEGAKKLKGASGAAL